MGTRLCSISRTASTDAPRAACFEKRIRACVAISGAAADVTEKLHRVSPDVVKQEAMAAGADLIAAYGGDGTALDVANGMAGSDIPMAILPGGTANVMAKELGVTKMAMPTNGNAGAAFREKGRDAEAGDPRARHLRAAGAAHRAPAQCPALQLRARGETPLSLRAS